MVKLRALNLILIALVALLVASCGGSGRADSAETESEDIIRSDTVTPPPEGVKVFTRSFIVAFETGVDKSDVENLFRREDLWTLWIIRDFEHTQPILVVALPGHPSFGKSEGRLTEATAENGSQEKRAPATSVEVKRLVDRLNKLLSDSLVAHISLETEDGPARESA